jgi:hypothetical protein
MCALRHRCKVITLIPNVSAISFCSLPFAAMSLACASMAAISACFLLVTMASSAPPAIGDIPHFPAILYVKPVVGLNEQIFGVNEQISKGSGAANRYQPE